VLPSTGVPVFAFGSCEARCGWSYGRAYCGEGFCGEPSRGYPQRLGERQCSDRRVRAFWRQRRRWTRDAHSCHSHSVMNDLVGLLVLCRQASGKTGKPQPSLAEIGARMHAAHRQPQAVLQALGAKPLQCADAPDLYAILLNVCVRAGLERVPELFLLPAPGMNAYALGTPDNACISVTAGLLSGLSREEIAGILAHELGHILHHDTSAMNWAAAIHGEIVSSAQHGVAGLTAWRDDLDRVGPRALLLVAAPALARLLYFALSRDRELAADAIAVELIDHPGALTAALCKLEYFHSGLSPLRAHMKDNAVSNPLRSHPGTWERIFHLA
jgi:heat shock protein HtpX